MCKQVSHACLLSLNDYRRLLQQGKDAEIRHDDNCMYGYGDDDACINNANNVMNDDAVIDNAVTDDDDVCKDDDINVDVSPVPQNVIDSILSSGDKLAEEQQSDESSLGAFKHLSLHVKTKEVIF